MHARATIAHYPAQRKSAGRANSRLTWYVVKQRANPKEGARVISHMKIYEYVYVYVY